MLRGFSSFSRKWIQSWVAAKAVVLARLKSARASVSPPAASLAQAETESWKKPSEPLPIRSARSVHSLGGVFTFALPAA